MRTDLFIARRLRISTGKSSRSATGIVIAVAGVALAVTVMLVSLAVIKGFKNEIKAKVTAFESQLTVSPATDSSDGDNDVSAAPHPITLTPKIQGIISSAVPGSEVSLSITYPGVLKTPDSFSGIVFKSNPHTSLSHLIGENIIEGKMADFASEPNAVVLSAHTADKLGLKTGDKVGAYFFSDGTMRSRNLTVTTIFDTHFSDYDSNVAIVSSEMLSKIAGLEKNQGTRIDINAGEINVEEAANSLQNAFLDAYYSGVIPEPYLVDNARHRGALYFNWLDLLDTNVIVILALMAAVATFTLISSLFIIILERVNMIGILKAIGASNSLIRRIFILVAERLVVRGMIIGNIIGLGLIYLQSRFRFIPLNPESYYLSYVPVSIGWLEILILNLGVIVVAAGVLILPSHIIATISPAKSIRYD